MPRNSYLAAGLAMLCSPANAQDLTSMATVELIDKCTLEISSGFPVSNIAFALTLREVSTLTDAQRTAALACLKSAYGDDYIHEGSTFTRLDTSAQAAEIAEKKARQAADAAKREEAYRSALAEACIAELAIDRFRALTTPACRDTLISHGVTP